MHLRDLDIVCLEKHWIYEQVLAFLKKLTHQITVNNLLPKPMFISSGKIMVLFVSREWGQDVQSQFCGTATACKFSCAYPGVTCACICVLSVVSLCKAVHEGEFLA